MSTAPVVRALTQHECIAVLSRNVVGRLAFDDPAPYRTVLFRISVGEMTGRRAEPAADREPDAPDAAG